MTIMKPAATGTALVPFGTPTFAELLERLSLRTDLTPTRKRDLASGLRRVAGALQLAPTAVHAHLPWLQPRISAVSCRSLGLSPKTWSNLVSDCRAAMVLLDRVKPRANRRAALDPTWRELWEQLIAADPQKSIERAVGAFVFFLSRISVAPDEVTDAHAVMFRDELTASQLRRDPEDAYRRAVAAWNRAVTAWTFWPRQKLSVPSRQRVIRLRLEEAPASFRDDLDRCMAVMERPDPFDPDLSVRPLRPASLKTIRNQLLLFAGALVRTGIAAADIRDLGTLVEHDNVREGMRWLVAEAGGTPKKTHRLILQTLISVARRHVRPSANQLQRLEDLMLRLKKQVPQRRGLTEKNLDRLRPLRDPEMLARLLGLPEILFERGVALGASAQGLLLQRDAIMLGILRNHPVRRSNLISLRLDVHIQRAGLSGSYLVFREREVKNQQQIEFEMSPELTAMIDRHVALRAPLLCPQGTPWLFSNRKGMGPLQDGYVSTRVRQLVHRELGIAFNPHLARHTAAMVYLDARPGHYESVRRLLGHTSTSSTLDVYAGFETDSVGREYSAFVTRHIGAKGKKSRRG